MKLSDFCRWTGIDRQTANRDVKGMYRKANNCEPLATDLDKIAQNLKPLQQLSIARKHPKHLRRIIITCDANGSASAEMVGEWDGKLMGLVSRSIGPNGNRMYQRHIQSLRNNSPLPTFRSGPTAEEIKKEAADHKAKMLKAQKERQGEDAEIVAKIIEEVEAEKELTIPPIPPGGSTAIILDDHTEGVKDMVEEKPNATEPDKNKTQTTEVMQTEMPTRAKNITNEQLEAATGVAE